MLIKIIFAIHLNICIFIILYQIDDSIALYITTPYHPWYAKAGNNLTITCESKVRTKIDWVGQTQHTNFIDEPIIPKLDSNFIIQTLNEEPSGHVTSKLIIKNLSLLDLGTYICKNDDAAFQVWIQVLELIVQAPQLSGNTLKLGCLLNGFIGNIPTIDYDWTFNKDLIAHRHSYLPRKLASIFHNARELVRVNKYQIEIFQGLSNLVIKNPDRSDQGNYTCLFQLSTSLGTLYLEESFNYQDSNLMLKGRRLPDDKNSSISRFNNCDIIIFLILFLIYIKLNL